MQAHEALRQHLLKVQRDDQEDPLLFAQRDMVWLQNKRKRKGDSHKWLQKFVGLYQIIEAYDNHTYKIERQGQSFVQNEARLTLYHYCTTEPGKATTSLRLIRRANVKKALRPTIKNEIPNEMEVQLDIPFSTKTW